MVQNIKSAVFSPNKFGPGNALVKGSALFYSPTKSFESETAAEPKRKLMFNEHFFSHPDKLRFKSEIEESSYGERNRYLELFSQLTTIEDSFGFVHLVFHFDPFQCVYVGSTFEKIYGYSCRDMYEHTNLFYETAHPDDASFLMKQIKTLLKNGYNEFTYRIITKTGEIKYLKVNVWCLQDENLSYVINCYQKDVTSEMESDLEKSIKKHHFTSDLAVMLNSVDEFEQKLQLVVNKINQSIRADQVNLYEIDGENKQMVCRFIQSEQDPVIPQGTVVDIPPLKRLPEYINVFQFSGDEGISGFMRYWNKPEKAQSLMVVPVRIKQKIFGFIELIVVREKWKWNNNDLGFIGTIGNMVANFYDRKAINDELTLNYLKQELLANVSFRLNKYTDDREHVLKAVLGYIGAKKPDAERIFIYRYFEEEQIFRKTHEYVNPSLDPGYDSGEEYDSSLFLEMVSLLKTGKPYHVNDINQLNPKLQNLFGRYALKSILVVPLFADGDFFGIYGYGIYSHHHVWKKGEIEIAHTFAGTISHFIERQTIMRKLKNSEKQFKDISEKLPGCVFQAAWSREGEINLNYISPQFEQWSGIRTIPKISEEKLQQSIHPNDFEAFLKFKQELTLPHTEISFEGRFYFPQLGYKWLIIKATLAETKISGEKIYNGLLFDATENKQTESKLAEAGVSIQSIINNLETGILLVDDNDRTLYVNEKLLEMLIPCGMSETEITQQNGGILSATYKLVKDGISLMNHTSDLMKNRMEEKGKELFFYKSAEIITRNYIPIFRDQRFFAHLFIFDNVTRDKLQELEIQKAYKRVLTIIDYSDIGVLLLSENEKVLIVNEQFLKMYHIDEPVSRFVNQQFRILWEKMNESVDMEGINLDMIRDAIHSNARIVNREIKINETNTLRYFIEPVIADVQIQRDMHETLIQMIDITAQKDIEHTLRKAKEEAEVIAKAKSHILMTMSHEIRTPLNGILGFSTILKDSLTDPYQREMAEVIDQSGNRLMETLNAILDFSIIQSGRKSFKINFVSINKMLQEQICLYREMAAQKGLYLFAEVGGQIGITVAEQLLYKILQNLINNSIKYTITGGIKIEADIIQTDSGDQLELKVIDTGVGIDECMHGTIFEPFRQESEGYGRAFEGTGLGLSLVKEYIQKMEGQISLVSRKDEGSTFTVRLPGAYYENNDTLTKIISSVPESFSSTKLESID